MPTPVIIPAFNEEAHIEKTLRRLPRDVRPIVAANGTTDRTVEIAESFGAETLVQEEQGKLPAIQATLRLMGREALDPIIILDADTRPLFPQYWADHMVKPFSDTPEQPAGIGGPIIHTGRRLGTAALRTAYRGAHAVLYNIPALDRPSSKPVPQAGPSMSIHLHNSRTLDAVLDLPHYWPGEDRAVMEVIKANNGHYKALIDPLTTVFTPVSESYLSLRETIRIGLRQSNRLSEAAYSDRGAEGSIAYTDDHLAE